MNNQDDPFYQLGPVRKYLDSVDKWDQNSSGVWKKNLLQKLCRNLYKFGYVQNLSNMTYVITLNVSENALSNDPDTSDLDILKRNFYINLDFLCPNVELIPSILEFLTSRRPERQRDQGENISVEIKDICRRNNVRVDDNWQADRPYSNFKDIVEFFVSANGPPRIQQNLAQLFEERHIGPSSQPFFNFIKETIRNVSEGSPRVYSPCVSIVQSSMYGKSRLIKDLACHHVYISYMCLRQELASGYPRACFGRSIDRRETSGYFRYSNDSAFACDVVLFLICTLEVIVEGLERNDDDFTTLERFWNLQETSLVFEQNVEMRFLEKRDSIGYIWGSIRDESAVTITEDSVVISEGVKDLLRTGWRKYCSALKRNKDPKIEECFVLAIDEARSLGIQSKPDTMSEPFLKIFKRVARFFNTAILWRGFAIIFAGTPAAISDLSPPPEDDSSLIATDTIDAHPWYNLGTFDLHVRWGETPLTLDFTEIGTLRYYAKFGRPSWKLYTDSGHENELLPVASAKLRGRHIDNLSKYQLLYPVYAPSMSHDYRIAESLVESRMATLQWVSDHRDKIEVVYPSEPILALAAHRLLEGENDCELVTDLITDRPMPSGDAGELIARWMLLDALKTAGLRDGMQSNYCRVRDLFNGLQENYLVTSNHPDEHHLLNGRIHINHWKILDSKCTLNDLAEGFLRGCGFCFKTNQPAFDLVIPIYLESEHVDLTNIRLFEGDKNIEWAKEEKDAVRQAFSVIVIQVRNNQNSSDDKYEKIHDQMVHHSQQIFERKRPYIITAYFQLGESPPVGYRNEPSYKMNLANFFSIQEDSGDTTRPEGDAVLNQDFALAYDIRVTATNANKEFIDKYREVVLYGRKRRQLRRNQRGARPETLTVRADDGDGGEQSEGVGEREIPDAPNVLPQPQDANEDQRQVIPDAPNVLPQPQDANEDQRQVIPDAPNVLPQPQDANEDQRQVLQIPSILSRLRPRSAIRPKYT
ncbi:hypothetical protein AWJ20_602 [Sugiyamaella lignohabitans]|uniref:Uncharacterized protein n=1 Tax=Sugiyamaella lignohabitans TaxID=796027 RepID=A0A167D166_9ASCO|nr:uncharacterized protein AWJ20_602 [Sugiyamaella lignohabitans]ANB12352.1 hypothetical protein AWJ20_602 [Sugiyamaella lignohabitans]